MDLLVVQNLTKIFAKKSCWLNMMSGVLLEYTAINNVSFTLKEKEIMGLVGSNGAGKSTLMHMLSGILTPTSGAINYFGKEFAKYRNALLQEVAFASSYCKLAPSLTVVQNLKFFAQIYNMPKEKSDKKIDELLLYFGLANYKHTQVAELSAGECNKVSILKVFLPDTKIVLLDEPTAFLDLKAAALVRNLIKEQRSALGTAFLVTTHNHQDIIELCDKLLILQHGKMTESSVKEYIGAQGHNQTLEFFKE